jgi:hypothetical protein
MMAAGLVAKKAAERGLTVKPWVKTSLAPARRWSPSTCAPPASSRTSTRSASTWSATAAPPASATPARCTTTSPRPIRGRPGRGLGAVGQPQLRGPREPRGARQLPGVAAAGGRLRPRRHHGHRPRHEPLGLGKDGKPVFLRDVWPSHREVAEADAQRRHARAVRVASTRRARRRRRAGRPSRRRRATPSRGTTLDLRPQAALLRRHDQATPAPLLRRQGRARAGRARRQRSPPTTSRPPATSPRDSPAGAVPHRATASPRPTSTSTAPAAATTR